MPLTEESKLRTVRFQPYRKGMGPTFTLTTWDTGRTGYGGKYLVGYRLTMHNRFPAGHRMHPWVVFEGEDFGCSPMHAIDSDETLAGIMSFLTLRPGDTDREYFEDYTEAQLDYCSQHAEALANEVWYRFNRCKGDR